MIGSNHFLVAIDGPAGAGKSTIAKMVADQINLTYVDSGAIYRRIAYDLVQQNIGEDDLKDIKLTQLLKLKISPDKLRTPEIVQQASIIAKIETVRTAISEYLRALSKQSSLVMEGRDIGSCVLPYADVKIFLTASPKERAARRWSELRERGIRVDQDDLLKEIELRDKNDSTRELDPLRQAPDAILIDTTNYTLDEVVSKIIEICNQKIQSKA